MREIVHHYNYIALPSQAICHRGTHKIDVQELQASSRSNNIGLLVYGFSLFIFPATPTYQTLTICKFRNSPYYFMLSDTMQFFKINMS